MITVITTCENGACPGSIRFSLEHDGLSIATTAASHCDACGAKWRLRHGVLESVRDLRAVSASDDGFATSSKVVDFDAT